MANYREHASPHRHVCSVNDHALEHKDTTGPRFLMTLGLDLLVPAAQVAEGESNGGAIFVRRGHPCNDALCLKC